MELSLVVPHPQWTVAGVTTIACQTYTRLTIMGPYLQLASLLQAEDLTALEFNLHNTKYELVAYDGVTGIVRVNIDLHDEARQQSVSPLCVLSQCRVVNVTKGRLVPHRVYYTNDLQFEMEQVAWQAEAGDEYCIDVSVVDDQTPALSSMLGTGEPLLLEEGPLDLGACHPHLAVVDWDGDGRQDLIVGISGEAGYLYFLRNTSDDENPVFQPGVRLRADGKLIKADNEHRKVGISQPWVGDWDGDGLVDLLLLTGAKGDEFESRIEFFRNIGSSTEPILTSRGPLLNEKDEPLVLSVGPSGFYNCFHPADWTRNGTQDILAVIPDDQFHGIKQLVYFENVGTKERPRFSQTPRPITSSSGNEICFRGLIDAFLPADWVRVGYPDVLLATGMYSDKIFLYENGAKNPTDPPLLLDSGPAVRSDKPQASAPSDFQTDLPAPALRLHNGEDASMRAISPQVSSIQAVHWGGTAKRELLVATNEGYLARFRNLATGSGKPALAAAEVIRSRNPAMFVGAFAVPACADWNGDGKPELIVGSEWGELHYFENTGTAEHPIFAAGEKIRAGGEVIRYPGCFKQILENENGYSSPVAIDLDQDGLIDLVVSESRGYLNYYRNIGTPSEAIFDQGQRLYLDGDVLHNPWRVMPALFQLEGEDFTRMISKEADGTFYLYTNGKADLLTFSKQGPLLMESGQHVTDNGYGLTRMATVDWHGDGRHDLILGTHGHRLVVEGDRYHLETVGGGGEGAGLIRFENIGTNSVPLYKLPQEVKVGGEVLRRGMGHAVNPSFTNWFGDVGNDLVLGTEDGRVYLYRRQLLS